MKILGIIILTFFYAVYLGKMLLQKRKGIQTDQIAKGKKKDKVFYTELIMKIATYAVVIMEVLTILNVEPKLPQAIQIVGNFTDVFQCAVIDFFDFCNGDAAFANLAGGAVFVGCIWNGLCGI